jgi:hypothetical protein
MTDTEQGDHSTPGKARRPQRLLVPEHLPGEEAYGTFMHHMMECADCGYGQVQCEKATELLQAYKKARRKRT